MQNQLFYPFSTYCCALGVCSSAEKLNSVSPSDSFISLYPIIFFQSVQFSLFPVTFILNSFHHSICCGTSKQLYGLVASRFCESIFISVVHIQ